MRKQIGPWLLTFVLVTLLAIPEGYGSNPVFLPNLGKNATGTTVGGKQGIDVKVLSGGAGAHLEDDPHVSGDEGVQSLCVRNDAGVALAADGDYIPCTTDNTGRLRVDAAITEAATSANGGSLSAVVKVVAGYDGTNVRVIKTNSSGDPQVDVISSALPSGAATEAGHLAAIDASSSGIGASLNSIRTSVAQIPADPAKESGKLTTIDSSAAATAAAVAGLGASLNSIRTSVANIPASPSTAGKQPALGTPGVSSNDVLTVQGTSNGIPIPVTSAGMVAAKTYQNTAGSFVLNAALTTVITESAPATAIGFVLEAKDSNAANIRWAIGSVATTTNGMQLQPGRDTGFVPCSANVSIVAESGTLEYQLTWVKQ